MKTLTFDGLISFGAPRCIFKKGVCYRCIKDVFDNENKLHLFTKGEYYICSIDNTLLANNDKVIYWNKLNNPLEYFVEIQNK